MMSKKINHVGIAVKNINQSSEPWKLLGLNISEPESVPHMGVKVSFLTIGDSKIELLEPMAKDSPVAKFLEKKGEGVHHICIEVKDLQKISKDLISKNIQLIYDEPKPGANNTLVNFIHPKSFHGVLLELCQKL